MDILSINASNYAYDIPDIQDDFEIKNRGEMTLLQNEVPLSDDGVSNEVKKTMRQSPIVIPIFSHRMRLAEDFNSKNKKAVNEDLETNNLDSKEEIQNSKHVTEWYEKLFQNTAEGVEKAWNDAKRKVGADGSGFAEDGKITHITQIMVDRFMGKTNDLGDILGNTIESAYNYAKRAVEKINEELSWGNKPNKEAEELTKQEKEFYMEFLNNLEALKFPYKIR